MDVDPTPARAAPAAARSIPEADRRYPGWRIVFACFVLAIFSWGVGFYGQGIYLAELHALRGWPVAYISTSTTGYYLLSAILVVFVGDAMARLGPRLVLAGGILCLAVAAMLAGQARELWQLALAYLLMSAGWASTGVAAITTVLGLWFREKRGLAISLALNGASVGGIVGVPVLVALAGQLGFPSATLVIGGVMVLGLVPLLLAAVRAPEGRLGTAPAGVTSPAEAEPEWTRGRALRSRRFWTITGPFALALLVQVGFVVHLATFAEPIVGRTVAGAAVSLAAVAATFGRIGLGFVIDRVDVRLASAASFASQAVALGLATQAGSPAALLLAAGLFGLSVGNVITLPPLIIHREFPATAFAMLVGLSTAIGQLLYAFGPGTIGWLRDLAGGYGAALALCAVLDLAAAAIVLLGRGAEPREVSS